MATTAINTIYGTVGRRLFVPALHLWYRPLRREIPVTGPAGSSSVLQKSKCREYAWSVEIGFTDRGLDDIGDISAIKSAHASTTNNTPCGRNTPFQVGDNLVNVEWEGHVITAADELYHTVWETISGVKTIPSPVNGKIIRIFEEDRGVNEDDTLVELSTDEESLQAAIKNLVNEEEYERIIQEQPTGKFTEDLGT